MFIQGCFIKKRKKKGKKKEVLQISYDEVGLILPSSSLALNSASSSSSDEEDSSEHSTSEPDSCICQRDTDYRQTFVL